MVCLTVRGRPVHQVLNAGSGKARQWIMNKLLSIFADSLKEQARNRPLTLPLPALGRGADERRLFCRCWRR